MALQSSVNSTQSDSMLSSEQKHEQGYASEHDDNPSSSLRSADDKSLSSHAKKKEERGGEIIPTFSSASTDESHRNSTSTSTDTGSKTLGDASDPKSREGDCEEQSEPIYYEGIGQADSGYKKFWKPTIARRAAKVGKVREARRSGR